MGLMNFPRAYFNCFVLDTQCCKEKQLRSVVCKLIRPNCLQIFLLLKLRLVKQGCALYIFVGRL